MKFVKYLFFTIIFVFSTLIFIPKQNLYFLAEKELKKYDVVISDEKFINHILGFELIDAKLYVKGINIAKLTKVDISLLGIDIFSKEIGKAYTKVNIDNKSIVVYFEPTRTFTKKYSSVLKYFKKEKKGKYKYEYKLF